MTKLIPFTDMEEEWQSIPGYRSRYLVSDKGRVASKVHGLKLMTPNPASHGRMKVNFTVDNDTERRYVARLVAEAFLDTPNTKYKVEYIDGNPKNCEADNLRVVKYRKFNFDRASPDTGLRRVVNEYQRNAHKRGVEWDIDPDRFAQIAKKNCFYCGVEPTVKRLTTTPYNGVDRIDPDKGYTKDNVVPCCSNCNYMKRDRTKEEFLSTCQKIAKENPDC